MKKFFKRYIFSSLLAAVIISLLLSCIESWSTFHIATKILIPYCIGCLTVILYDNIKKK